MASLLSKPKKSGPSLRKIKGQISGVDRAIDRVQEKLDEEIGRLADSLDRQKLGMDPGSVADEIAAYMESKQDGWDCSSGGKAALVPQPFFILKEKIPLLLEQFEYIFIPSAFAKEPTEPGDGLEQDLNEESIPVPSRRPSRFDPCEVPDSLSCLQFKCKDSGGSLFGNDKICNCPNNKPRLIGNRCQPCLTGFTPKGGKCVCPPDTHVKRNGKCRKKTPSEKCRDKEGDWRFSPPGRCYCPPETHVKDGEQCRSRTDKDECEEKQAKGFEWDDETNRCVNKKQANCIVLQVNGFVWKGNECVCSEKTPNRVAANKCEACGEDKPKWNSTKRKCESCPENKPNWNAKNRTCESCPADKPNWSAKNRTCESCPADKPNWSAKNRTCEACPGNKPKWNSIKKDCVSCPDDKPHWSSGERQCITKKENCQAQNKVWIGGEGGSCCETNQFLNSSKNGQCVSRCPSNRPRVIGKVCHECLEGFILTAGECICPEKTHVRKNGKCRKKTSEEKCEEKEGSWKLNSKGVCDCPQKTHVEESGNCRLKKGSEKCEGDTPVWDSNLKDCIADCPAGKPKWNSESKSCEACPSGQILQNGQCDCPDWKKDEAFGNNGKVSNRFCDKYASNKADCRKGSFCN